MKEKQNNIIVKRYYDDEYCGKQNKLKVEGKGNKYFSYYGQFLDLLDIKNGKRILDIACGSGGLIIEAEKRGMVCYVMVLTYQR
ncbi:MAG TPA: hypothetical protein ENH85_15275 [Candidatus Scalindua sp.]|nr:hypothetical protein [Candidatus Scalindua sp.]